METKMAEAGGDIGKKGWLTAEEMRDAGDVEKKAIGFVQRNPGAPALAPAGKAQKHCRILFRLMKGRGEIGHLGARISQSLPRSQAEAERQFVAGEKAQTPGSRFNDCEGLTRDVQGRETLLLQSMVQPFHRKLGQPERSDALHVTTPLSIRQAGRPGSVQA